MDPKYQAPRETYSSGERSRLLWDAARDYLAGNLTVEEYSEIEDRYGTDYVAAMLAIARVNMQKSENIV